MVAIGEPATAFVFIFAGLFNQFPWLLCATLFVLNDLPHSKLSNHFFTILYVGGLATSSIAGIGNAMLWVAGADVATSSAIYISLFAFTFLRVVALSIMAIWVKRKLMRTRGGQQSFLFPAITTRLVAFATIAWMFHVVEGVLAACIPSATNLINYVPLYMYIPGFVVHTVLTGALIHGLLNAPQK
jgi:hypothetical protein